MHGEPQCSTCKVSDYRFDQSCNCLLRRCLLELPDGKRTLNVCFFPSSPYCIAGQKQGLQVPARLKLRKLESEVIGGSDGWQLITSCPKRVYIYALSLALRLVLLITPLKLIWHCPSVCVREHITTLHAGRSMHFRRRQQCCLNQGGNSFRLLKYHVCPSFLWS